MGTVSIVHRNVAIVLAFKAIVPSIARAQYLQVWERRGHSQPDMTSLQWRQTWKGPILWFYDKASSLSRTSAPSPPHSSTYMLSNPHEAAMKSSVPFWYWGGLAGLFPIPCHFFVQGSTSSFFCALVFTASFFFSAALEEDDWASDNKHWVSFLWEPYQSYTET